MTKEEREDVFDYIESLIARINKAKNSIRDMNFGKALMTLEEPIPRLRLKVDR